jgi:hypothetical protein
MTLALLFACIGCAPAVRYSKCDVNTDCPSGTVCQQVSPQHAICKVPCAYEIVDGELTFSTTCEQNSARCFRGPYQSTSDRDLYFCRLPCDSSLDCPSGLGCMMGEVNDQVGLWCM